jgi:hypothetical protein
MPFDLSSDDELKLDPAAAKAAEADGKDEDTEVALGPDAEGDTTNPDGSTEVTLEGETPEAAETDFYDNLADGVIEDTELARLSADLVTKITADKDATDARIKSYAEAMKKAGLNANSVTPAFDNGSTVAHPMMLEASVDFASSAIRELFPMGGQDSGPVKHQTWGKVTQAKVDKARKKTQYMNYQLTSQMPGFRATLEEMLSQVPMAGMQYLKLNWDRARRRPVEMFVPVDKLYVPYAATTFDSAERITHAQDITGNEYKRRVASGMYVDKGLSSPSAPETSDVQEVADDVTGRIPSVLNVDENRTIWECSTFLEVEGDDRTKDGEDAGLAPYLVHIDQNSGRIIGLYRNWFEDDEDREALLNIVEFPFIYWSGGPIGLPALIGTLNTAATGALNAILDAAHVSNLQAAVKLKGGSNSQTINIAPGTIVEVEGSFGQSEPDIRKTVMPLPFPQPSPVLFQLLGFLTDMGKGVTQITLEKLAESNGEMPVGTTLALIEQGAKVYSAIHSRLHNSMGKVLKVLHNLNRLYLDDKVTVQELGELIVHRKDFEGPMDVAPCSDPNIFSETQRYAQIQFVMQRQMTVPGLYDPHKVEELALQYSKIPNAKDLLTPKPEPKRLNAVNENVASALQSPIIAFADQDHRAHLKIHLAFYLHPLYGQNPLLQGFVQPALAQHIREHLVYLYVDDLVNIGTAAAKKATGKDITITELMDDDPEVSRLYDQMLVDANTLALQDMASLDQVLPDQQMLAQAAPQQLMQLMAQMAQMLASMQPPQPMDPTVVAAKQVEVESKKADIAGQKAQGDTQVQAQELELEKQKMGQDAGLKQMEIQSKETMNMQDNATAMALAQGEWEHHEKVAVSDGAGINPSP